MPSQKEMQLLNMFVNQMQGIGQQRQQRSMARAGMQQDKARMEQEREFALKQLDQEAAALKSLNALRKAQIGMWETDQKMAELGVKREAELAEYATVSQPTTETETDVATRGATALGKDVEPDMGVFSSMAAIAKNLPAAVGIAGRGPQTTPGMTPGEFIARESAEGVPMEQLAGVARLQPQKTDWVALGNEFKFASMAKTPYDKLSPAFRDKITPGAYQESLDYSDRLNKMQEEGLISEAEYNTLRNEDMKNKVEGAGIYAPRYVGSGPAPETTDLSAIFGTPTEKTSLQLLYERYPDINLEQLSAGITNALAQPDISREALESELVDNYGLSDVDAKALLDEIAGSSE